MPRQTSAAYGTKTMLPMKRFATRSDKPLDHTVKKLKLKWYSYVSQSSGLTKTILQGSVRGARRRGRQKKR